MISVEPADSASSVLVITAHPDDVDFGFAGSAAAWTRAGATVTYCVVTDGEAGGSDRSMSRPAVAELRRGEQKAAAAEVGVSDVRFLGYPDGRLVVSIDLRRELSRVIREVRPERVVCQSPERNWDFLAASHPDHLAAGEAAVCAVFPDSRNPFAHPELLEDGLEPHTVGELWVMAHAGSNRAVDVTETFDRKIAALLSHKSQIADARQLEERVRGWLTSNAIAAGLPEGRLAECFKVIETG